MSPRAGSSRRTCGNDTSRARSPDGGHGVTPVTHAASSEAGARRCSCAPDASPRTVCGPVETPETRYAHSGDLKIAYQVVGEGPLDVVFVPTYLSNIELFWELPSFSRLLGRLSSFSRLILFELRGSGMSDGVAGVTPLEEQMDDVRAVTDDACAQQPVLFSFLEGCGLAAMFAASHPDLVRALVLISPQPRLVAGPGYEWAPSVEERASMVSAMVESGGTDSPDNPLAVLVG